MFDSAVLNVVIGLVFIYLLYSLLATTLNEAIASVFNLRSRKLEKALTRMLDDGIDNHYNIWIIIKSFFVRNWKRLRNFLLYFYWEKPQKIKNPNSLKEAFYNHEGIKYLGENKISDKPSYISAEFFSKAIIDILRSKGDIPEAKKIDQITKGIDALAGTETKKFIKSLLFDADNDLEKFRILLENWFNETMARTSGWYKKQSQRITFALGIIIAIAFNVNTIAIVTNLSRNPEAAEKLADAAALYSETHKDKNGELTTAQKDKTNAIFDSAIKLAHDDAKSADEIIGLGWNVPSKTVYKMFVVDPPDNWDKGQLKKISNLKYKPIAINDTLELKKMTIGKNEWVRWKNNPKINLIFRDKSAGVESYYKGGKFTTPMPFWWKFKFVINSAFSSWRNLIGYLLTAIAISFGAPFWFDLLNKFIQLRGSGKKPEEKTDNKTAKTTAVNRVG